MQIHTYPVRPVLKPFIRLFLSIDVMFPKLPLQHISPKGEAALFFPFKQSSYWGFSVRNGVNTDSKDGMLAKCTLVGQSNTYGTTAWDGQTSLIIVPLTTSGFYHFLQESTHTVSNSFYSLDYLNHSSPHQALQERLWEVSDSFSAFKLIETFLIQHFINIQPRFLSTNVQPITDFIEKNIGLTQANALARKFRLSSRRVEQLFTQQVGISPKQFSKVVRFRSLIQRMHLQPQTNLMQFVADYNFSDESHLIRDFKQLLNITPTLYAENKPLFDQIAFNHAFP